MPITHIVSEEDWKAANDQLVEREKEFTRLSDELAASRRRQPVMEVVGDFRFVDPKGDELSLIELFGSQRQLIVYHAMLDPDSDHLCSGCHMFLDNLGKQVHLNQRSTRMVAVSPGTPEQIAHAAERLKVATPWYSTFGFANFNEAMGTGSGFGLSVFIRDDEHRAFRSYYTSGRGVEKLGTSWDLLDLTPLGRQETWEDSPEGWPQDEPYAWWKLNDEYASVDR